MRNKGQNLGYQEKKKIFFKSWKSRRERESVLQNLENREEKEKFNTKILRTERRKRNDFSKSWKSRGERDMKFHFSSSRGETKNNFSSRISRDRDSCQGLLTPPVQWCNLYKSNTDAEMLMWFMYIYALPWGTRWAVMQVINMEHRQSGRGRQYLPSEGRGNLIYCRPFLVARLSLHFLQNSNICMKS